MKFLLDHNLPPALARALNELSAPYGHSVFHLTEKFASNSADLDWIKTLIEEGDWTIISQDQFNKSDLEKEAFRRAGLTVFCLARQWRKAPYWEKAYRIIRWWPLIIAQSELLTGGAALKVPWNYYSKRFEQIKG